MDGWDVIPKAFVHFALYCNTSTEMLDSKNGSTNNEYSHFNTSYLNFWGYFPNSFIMFIMFRLIENTNRVVNLVYNQRNYWK